MLWVISLLAPEDSKKISKPKKVHLENTEDIQKSKNIFYIWTLMVKSDLLVAQGEPRGMV